MHSLKHNWDLNKERPQEPYIDKVFKEFYEIKKPAKENNDELNVFEDVLNDIEAIIENTMENVMKVLQTILKI